MATSKITQPAVTYKGGFTPAGNLTVNYKYVTKIGENRMSYLINFTANENISSGTVLFTNLNEIDGDYITYSLGSTSYPVRRQSDGRVKANNTIPSGGTITVFLPY